MKLVLRYFQTDHHLSRTGSDARSGARPKHSELQKKGAIRAFAKTRNTSCIMNKV